MLAHNHHHPSSGSLFSSSADKKKMALSRSRNLLRKADSPSRRRLLRPRFMRKKKTGMKNMRASFCKLKSEMQEVRKDQQVIREGQSQVKEKLAAIKAECTQLRKETERIMQQSALNKLKICLMFNIHKAREEGDLARATQLVHVLRSILTMADQRQGST